jgi:hybrid cluster-associated redox disulfide protein
MSDKITKEMTFAQVLRMHPDVVKVFARFNLGCVGCMGAQNESLEQGCGAHGLDVNDVLKELNALFAE